MSAPFDLSEALKKPPVRLNTPGGPGGKPSRRPPVNVQIDEFCRKVIWAALVVCGLLFLYLGWGLFAGAWTGPSWAQALHVYRLQQLANIETLSGILRIASVLLIAAMVYVFRYDEGAGFALLGVAIFIYFGLPLITTQVFSYQNWHSTVATQSAVRSLQDVALIYGVPGLIWSIVDIGRRFKSAAEAALIKQANQKYAEASAAHALGVKTPGKRRLTPYQRQQRRYQALALAIVVGEPVLVFLNLGTIQNWLQGVLALTQKLSFTTNPSGISQLQGSDGTLVLWVLLIALGLVVLAQSLRLLEYICFRDVV